MDRVFLGGPQYIDFENRGFSVQPIGEVIDYREIDNTPNLLGAPTACDATHPLVRLIKKFDIKYGIEVGVEKGYLSENILRHTQVLRWYMLDSWKYEHAIKWVKSGDRLMRWQMGLDGDLKPNQRRLSYIFRQVREKFSQNQHRTQVIRWSSPEGSDIFKRNSLDLVFLDTLHFWGQLYPEIDEWRKVLKPGGILCGDDISPYYKDVEEVVRVWFQNRYHVWGRVWWVQVEEEDVV